MQRSTVVDDVSSVQLYPICLEDFLADVVWIHDIRAVVWVGVLDDGVRYALAFKGERREGRVRDVVWI